MGLFLKDPFSNIKLKLVWVFVCLNLKKIFYHGHGLFLQFFGVFRSVEDLFTSAYYAGNQAVKQEASL